MLAAYAEQRSNKFNRMTNNTDETVCHSWDPLHMSHRSDICKVYERLCPIPSPLDDIPYVDSQVFNLERPNRYFKSRAHSKTDQPVQIPISGQRTQRVCNLIKVEKLQNIRTPNPSGLLQVMRIVIE